MPKVSVIILVYNAAPFIERCARSLFEQTLDDIEYIFVNDCTPDNSFEILEKVLKDYPMRAGQVKIVNLEKNSGQAAARTAGMKAATGQYQIHCDSDDWLEPDAYEKLYDKAVAEMADIVGCKAFVHQNGKTTIAERYFEGDPAECLFNLRYGCVLWAKLVSTNLIHDNEIYPYEGIDNGEDLNVSVRIYLKAKKMGFVNLPLYHYNRDNIFSITKNSDLWQLKKYAIPNIERISEELLGSDDERKDLLINTLKLIYKKVYLGKPHLSINDIKFLRRLWPECHAVIGSHDDISPVKSFILRTALKNDITLWIYHKLLRLKNRLKT